MTKCDLRRFFPLVLIISPQKFHCLLFKLFKVLGVTENFLKFFIFLLPFLHSFLPIFLSFFFFPLWPNNRLQTTRSCERPRKKKLSESKYQQKKMIHSGRDAKLSLSESCVSVNLMPWLLLQRTIHLGWLALLWCNSVSCCMVSKM